MRVVKGSGIGSLLCAAGFLVHTCVGFRTSFTLQDLANHRRLSVVASTHNSQTAAEDFLSELFNIQPPSDDEDSDMDYIRFKRNPELKTLDLQTKVVKLKKNVEREDGSKDIFTVDLYSILHIADEEFFKEVEQFAGLYDRVLYELIVSNDSVCVDEEGRKKISRHLYPTIEQVNLARQYGLKAQLDVMDFLSKRNWYIADLDRDTIMALQEERGENSFGAPSNAFSNLIELWRVVFQGRAPDGEVLPNFFLPGRGWGLGVRALLWATPCPELNLVLLDWARGTSPRGAGTLSAAAGLLVDALAAGEGATARKIAFGQMLLSGQADGGEGWGRGAGVIVRERNRAAAAEVARAARELAPQGGGSCAVLYGGLHMQDLERRLSTQGFYRAAGAPPRWLAAWRMPFPARRAPAALKAGLVPLYVAVGALDWIGTIVNTVKDLADGDASGAALGAGLYLLRHAYLYYGLARYLVRWDRRLFQQQQ